MGFDEADIRAGLRGGGTVQSAFIVGRFAAEMDDVRYVAYLRTNWRRGYHILQTYKHKGDKIYVGHGLHRLVWLIQKEFQHRGPLVVYEAGCRELQRFTGLLPIDRGLDPVANPGPSPAEPPKVSWEWPADRLPGSDGEPPKD